MTDEKIKRINELYHKSKSTGLTEAEKEEYADLYCKCENELIKNSRRCDNL